MAHILTELSTQSSHNFSLLIASSYFPFLPFTKFLSNLEKEMFTQWQFMYYNCKTRTKEDGVLQHKDRVLQLWILWMFPLDLPPHDLSFSLLISHSLSLLFPLSFILGFSNTGWGLIFFFIFLFLFNLFLKLRN